MGFRFLVTRNQQCERSLSPHECVATRHECPASAGGIAAGGFVVDRISGSHHMLVHVSDARRTVTVPFHGAQSIKTGTLRGIIRQAGLTVEEFRRLL